jgi:hypothetical protein
VSGELVLGCTEPRIWTRPLVELDRSTSLGYACIDFAEQVLRMTLFPWQRWLLVHLLERRPSGVLRFRTAILIVARQAGKTTIDEVIALFFMYVLGRALVIGTAQSLDIAEESWQATVDLAESTPELAAEIARIDRTSGKKTLRLTRDEQSKETRRYKVASATRRGGRGLSGDLVLLDELREHQTWEAWSAVSKTTLAREAALILGLSSAGDISSVVLRHLRRVALESIAADGDAVAAAELQQRVMETAALIDDDDVDEVEADDTLALFEWSAPAGSNPRDRHAQAQANPTMNLPGGISERSLAAAQRTDPPHVFAQECLGIWAATTSLGPFPAGSWLAGSTTHSAIVDGSAIGACVDVSWDRAYAHVAVAGYRSDGDLHVEVATTRAGLSWVKPWLVERQARLGFVGVAVQEKGAPVSTLLAELVDAGLPVMPWANADLGIATGQFYDLVAPPIGEDGNPTGRRVWHLPQPVLDVPAASAIKRQLTDAWVIDRKRSPDDAAPLVAAIGAVWALLSKPAAPRVSAYETRRLVSV